MSWRYAEPSTATAMALGDCTWHHGWTLHCAPPNDGAKTRWAYTASFFRDGAVRLDSEHTPHGEDMESWSEWARDIPPGAKARHELLPVVWPPLRDSKVVRARAKVQGSRVFSKRRK